MTERVPGSGRAPDQPEGALPLDRIDQWLTTDPRDDGVECGGASGTPYPEHEFGDDHECHRCGAQSDDYTGEDELICWDSDKDDAQGFATHDFSDGDGHCNRCEYEPDYCVYGWYYTSMNSIGPEWDECGETAAWRAIRRCRSPLPLCDQHKREWEQGELAFELAPKGDVLLRIEPYDPLTGEDRFSEDASWHTTNEEGTACLCDPQPKTKWERYDAGLVWNWDDKDD